jgi:hypothetical protein
MSNTLSVRLSSRKSGDQNWYEGTVSITGLKPTKLARRSDGSTQFPTKSAVSGAARNLAKSLGFSDVDVSDSDAAKATTAKKVTTPVKTAAKKSAVVKAPAKTATKKSATVKSS